MFDRNKLKYYVAERGATLADVAKKLSINPATLQRKMSGVSEFDRKEIKQIIDYLDLSEEVAFSIFFKR